MRSITITMDHVPTPHVLITADILHKIILACDALAGVGPMLKCAFLPSFFGFLRVSNLAPNKITEFNPKKHTCRCDLLFNGHGLVILLKWTNMTQTHEQVTLST